jgi:hypothetical protein
MARGGYRKPSKPAPVSGPGKLSRRTDGGAGSKQAMMEVPSNGQYGYRSGTMAATQGASLAGGAQPSTQVDVTKRAANMATPVTPIDAATAFPGRPVTHGSSMGPGLTPDYVIPDRYAMIKKYSTQLDSIAAQDEAPPEFKQFWAYVKTLAGSQ